MKTFDFIIGQGIVFPFHIEKAAAPPMPSGLAPYGTNWNLYGVEPCEYGYLSPGIHLHGLSSYGSYMFTCAESPERLDFTRIKSIHISCENIAGAGGVCGGIAAIPVTHSAVPQSTINYSVLQTAEPGQTEITVDCRMTGGQQFLLFYSDLDSTLNVTGLSWETYPDEAITDVSSETWEQRNFDYSSSNVITCNAEIPIPAGVSAVAAHIRMLSQKEMVTCLEFLDENKNSIGYGDGWSGNNPDSVPVSTHFQDIPDNAAYIRIAGSYTLLSEIQPSDLETCLLCFS